MCSSPMIIYFRELSCPYPEDAEIFSWAMIYRINQEFFRGEGAMGRILVNLTTCCIPRNSIGVRLLISSCLSFLCVFSCQALAAGNVLTPSDTNSRITVENAVVNGNETTIFFLTWPDLGDPNSGKDCGLNYYSATFKPGLPSARADVVAKGVCSGLLQKSRLLDSGDALIIARDRLEQWRAGERIKSQAFSSIDATSKLNVTTANMGGQFYDISRKGDVVVAMPAGAGYSERHFPDSSMVVTGLKPDGKRRWQVKISNEEKYYTVHGIWAAADGGALMHKSVHLVSSRGNSDKEHLYFAAASGSTKLIPLREDDTGPDIDMTHQMTPEELQKFFEQQRNSKPEKIEKLDAVARKGGGFDILFHREGGEEGREGFFLYRLSPDGTLLSEISLGNHIVDHGLERWFDFYLEGDQLVLLSSAAVTQKIVRKVKKKWGQNIVSWIDLDTGIPIARMIPLDERYLEAAMNAGDEGQQYLEGQPGSEPAVLTTLAGKPLVVSVGWISHRQVLRLHEADEHLMAYTEAYDEKQARLAKQASSKQRKAEREARMQRMQVAKAEAAGMTLEEYNALSSREQKETLVRSGGFDKLMETMTQESQIYMEQQKARKTAPARQGTPVQQPGMPQDANAQIAAAIAEAQQQMANNPNMTPEMRAQMAAIMGQMAQVSGGQPASVPGMPSQPSPQAGSDKSTTLPENALKVDSGMRAFIEYENKDGRPITLLVFDRKSGRELLKKDYQDGVIYEYVDFSKFGLPLEQIGVIYREGAGMILKDLTPVVAR